MRRASLRGEMLRVLVVENHSDTREGIQHFLKMLGYHAIAADNAAEALAIAERETFDLLLSDITLPDGDGWKLLTTLRSLGREPRQAIAMSGLNAPADQARSREAGYKAHLVKPFAPQDLEKVLRQVADKLVPTTVHRVAGTGHQNRLRQRLHDGLCQQLAASSLLQAALVNRLEALNKLLETSQRTNGAQTAETGESKSCSEIVGEARRIEELVHGALQETRAIMYEMEP